GAPFATRIMPVSPTFSVSSFLSSLTCVNRKSAVVGMFAADVGSPRFGPGSAPGFIFPNGVSPMVAGSTHQYHLPSTNFHALRLGAGCQQGCECGQKSDSVHHLPQ